MGGNSKEHIVAVNTQHWRVHTLGMDAVPWMQRDFERGSK